MSVHYLRLFLKIIIGSSAEKKVLTQCKKFEDSNKKQRQLKQSIFAFLYGYHTALESNNLQILVSRLELVRKDFRGFAFEGAGTGLALLNYYIPWQRNRLRDFIISLGSAYTYLIHIGVGLAIPLMHRRVEPTLAQLDPRFSLLIYDGYGFYEGYLNSRKFLDRKLIPRNITSDALQAFDRGLGRSLWFITKANISQIQAIVSTFPSLRQFDLWFGVGFACTYAGGSNIKEISALLKAAGSYKNALSQATILAARARQEGKNLTSHTEIACKIFCGLSCDEASLLANSALENLVINNHKSSYLTWCKMLDDF